MASYFGPYKAKGGLFLDNLCARNGKAIASNSSLFFLCWKSGHDVIKPSFSHGEFISFKHATGTTAPTSTSATEEASEVSVNSGETTAVYSCPPRWLRTCLSKTLCFGEALFSGKVYPVTRETFANGFSENGIQDLLGGRGWRFTGNSSPEKSPRGLSDT